MGLRTIEIIDPHPNRLVDVTAFCGSKSTSADTDKENGFSLSVVLPAVDYRTYSSKPDQIPPGLGPVISSPTWSSVALLPIYGHRSPKIELYPNVERRTVRISP
jgi:hypothetical protein